ncbi:hypothetical protein ACIA8R_08730 [Nonomuraea sp. NPDC051191]|uniref:hypothetical protein n=1 Tax=Nonomuraea sp. NPDC051191 TaxID=3364372 RepID=UPI0037BA308D
MHLDVDGQGLAVRAEGHRRDGAVAAGEVLVVAGTLQGLVKALGSDLEHGEVAGVAVLVGPYFGGRQRPSTLLPRWSMGWVKNGVASRRGDGVDAGAGVTFQGPDGGVQGSGKQSVGVLVPSSAWWVSAECRSWCSVQPPRSSSSAASMMPGWARGRVSVSNSSAARR